MSSSVLYQITEVDPTSPLTKGKVYQVHKVTAEEAPQIGGKTYNAIMIKDPDDPLVSGKVYQVTFIDDPTDPTVKGKVYNAIVEGGGTITIVGPAVAPLSLDKAVADSLSYVKAYGGTEQRNLPTEYTQLEYIQTDSNSWIDTNVVPTATTLRIDYKMQLLEQAYISFFGSVASITPRNGLRIYYQPASSSTLWSVQSGSGVINQAIMWDSVLQGSVVATQYDSIVSTVNGNTATTSGGGINLTNPDSILIGTTHLGSNTSGIAPVKIWSFTITKDGNVVFNGIPAKNSSNVVGMYDLVSGTFFTNAGTGNLTAGDPAVPTPDAPMDIVCNNGVLKVRHQSGLPLGYTLLEYIESTGTQYIDTGVVANDTTGFDVTFQKTVNNYTDAMIIGSRNGADGRFWLDIDHSSVSVGSILLGWNVYFRTQFDANLNKTRVAVNYNNDRKVYVNDVESVSASTGLQSTLNTQNVPVYLFCANVSGTGATYLGSFKLFDIKITAESALVRNLVPARRNSDNVLGMYDTVSGQFFTNQGTGDFVAGDPVSDPVEIYADGTVETINARGKNLWDGKAYRGGLYQGRPYIISNTEVTSPLTSTSQYSGVGLVVKVIPGQQYCFSSDITNAQYRYIGFYANKEDVTDYAKVISSASSTTATAPAGANYAVFCCANAALGTEFSWTWAQAELGSTPTDYTPYYDGGTATCENLLSIGDYEDVQEILSGDVTRKVGIKVLDGTENIAYNYGVYGIIGIPYNRNAIVVGTSFYKGFCSHAKTYINSVPPADRTFDKFLFFTNVDFVGFGSYEAPAEITDVASVKQWLADQYNAGTPVIIVYPLATETTESVAGQTLNVTSGDNVIDITQASLDGLQLEAQYTKEA